MARQVRCLESVVGGAPCIEGTRLNCLTVDGYVRFWGLGWFLSVYPELTAEDVASSVTYCAERRCVQDNPKNFCFDCTLDKRPLEYGDDPKVNGWEIAAEIKRDLGF